MLKPTVYVTGNFNSESVRKTLIASLREHYYDVKDYHPTNDYIQDAIKLAKEVKADQKRKVGILICNTGRSMILATQNIDSIRNVLINKETSTHALNLGTANLISLGVKEWNEDEIIQISLKYLDAFMKLGEQEEIENTNFRIF